MGSRLLSFDVRAGAPARRSFDQAKAGSAERYRIHAAGLRQRDQNPRALSDFPGAEISVCPDQPPGSGGIKRKPQGLPQGVLYGSQKRFTVDRLLQAERISRKRRSSQLPHRNVQG